MILTSVSVLGYFQMIDLSSQEGLCPCFLACLTLLESLDGMPDNVNVTLLFAGSVCAFYDFELCSRMHLSYFETV